MRDDLCYFGFVAFYLDQLFVASEIFCNYINKAVAWSIAITKLFSIKLLELGGKYSQFELQLT